MTTALCSPVISKILSESSILHRPCIAMIVTSICALDLVEQASNTDISKPEIDGCYP